MKHLFIGILLLVGSFAAAAQTKSVSPFFPFIEYISLHFNLPEAVRNDCRWHYAVVKVSTNKANVITRFELINIDAFGEAMAGSFDFLKGYRFPAKLNIRQRPVVFCVFVDNQKFSCISEQATQNPPSGAVARILAAFQNQQQKQPDTIFLYNFAESIVYDTSN